MCIEFLLCQSAYLEAGIIIFPILEQKMLKLREGKSLVQLV